MSSEPADGSGATGKHPKAWFLAASSNARDSLSFTYVVRKTVSSDATPSGGVALSRAFSNVVVHSMGGNHGAAFGAARGVVYQLLIQQATLLSFMDVFRWMAEAAVLCIAAVFLFKKAAPPAHVELVE